MNTNEIYSFIDHTLLSPTSEWEQIKVICEDAIKYSTASVCIPPSYVKETREAFASLNICTVIGFPLGYNTTATKVFEAQDAVSNGADEIDMVVNQGDVKNKRFEKIQEEISLIKKAIGDKILKVIIETCNLTDEEKISLCRIVTSAGADYIKTSTGFGSGGATIEDIKLFKENIGADVKMKAAGGVKSKDDLEAFIGLGCSRIGTSSAIKILAGETTTGY